MSNKPNNAGVTPGKNHAATPLTQQMQEALARMQAGELTQAARIYEGILRRQPQHLEALVRLGVIAGQIGDPKKALIFFDKALKLDARNAALWSNRGLALQGLRRLDAALASYDRALALKPDYAIAHFNRGNVLKELGRANEAVASLDRTIAINGSFAEAHYNRAVILGDLKQWEAALAGYDSAIAIKGNYAEAHFNRGNIFRELTRWSEALASFDRAIECRASYAEAYLNRGDTLHALRRWDAALDSYERALRIRPGYPKALFNRGNIFRELKQLDAAVASYQEAASTGADIDFLPGSLRYARLQLCDWGDVPGDVSRLSDMTARGEAASPPFAMLAMTVSPATQLAAAQIWVRKRFPPNDTLPALTPRSGQGRLRIGYFSSDLHDHATSFLIAELLELHDRARFDVLAFSFGPDSQGTMRKRLMDACDQFIDVRHRSDIEVALLARELQVDIAVDLKGFTQDSRPGIFAARAAPLQINFLGYPGTMGAPYMDYLIADHILVPEDMRRHYVEKIIQLPGSYQVNDSQRRIADRVFSRGELDLPSSGFVFCCFNNPFKILPDTFDCWMRILKRVDDSVIWLFEDNATAAHNLRREAALRQVNPARLIFAKHMSLPEHLARHRAADLFIDTWPYNAHTTASDALWSGLPVLTCAGESFASRVAASLLMAIDLPELITSTPRDYEELAVTLATDPSRLGRIREQLARNRLTTPLFDTPRYVRQLESAYTAIQARHCAGLPTVHMEVAASQLDFNP
jgi:predicted O-linked N-acetylglucosamine transferase (SPINDLY family)